MRTAGIAMISITFGCGFMLVLLCLPFLVRADPFLSPVRNQTRHGRDLHNLLSRQNRFDRSNMFTVDDITPDGEVRAPVLLGVRRDLIATDGPGGLFGVCTRVYRMLYQVRLTPDRECQKYRSRQSVLGDISEFYHTLMESGRFNQTVEFPLADHFNRFVFKASFIYLASRATEPAIMIEATTEQNLQLSHVLCVESIKCPEPTTTTTTTTQVVTALAVTPTPSRDPLTRSGEEAELVSLSPSSRSATDPFWDTLLSGTEPKSWFLATVSLACLCLLLLIILLITWLYVCRLKRLHQRRRCRGTCRFGCRCPSDVIRQTVTDAAVCGPLDSQNQHLFASPLTPQGNGSLRSGSGFGAALYPAGTMTSSRWGSNGAHKVGTPLYVSLANASDKTTLLAANYPNAGCLMTAGAGNVLGSGAPGTNSVDNMSGTWSQLNGQRSSSHLPRRRLSQDALHRSTSDGSSVSGHAAHGSSKAAVQGRGGIGVGYLGGPVTSIPGAMLISNGNAVTSSQSPDLNGSVYYQQQQQQQQPPTSMMMGVTTYSYADSGRGSGVSPGLSQSPTRLNGRKMNERGYYAPHGPGSGPVTVTEEEEEHPDGGGGSASPRYFTTGPAGEKITLVAHSVDTRQSNFNPYSPDSLHPNAYAGRGSEGDLLNITPPSGFYDPNGSGGADSGLVNGSLASSSARSNNPHGAGNNFGPRSFLSPLYPILGSPTSAANDWSVGAGSNASASGNSVMTGVVSNDQHMVGAMDTERNSHCGTSVSGELTGCGSGAGPYASAKPLLSPRIYTASERML